jgi:predicted membrane protein
MEAGAAELEAHGLANSNCARVRFSGGVGRVALDFTGAWRQSMEADLQVGLGSLELRLPRDVGVAVHLSRFLASFEAAGFEKRGNVYYSANYGAARHQLILRVSTSIGSVDVTWAGPQQ